MRFFFFLFLFFLLNFFSAASAQNGNLVINPSFESDTFPAITTWPTANVPGRQVVKGWFTPTPATPDYYNSDHSTCDGFPIALAHTGQGRCAIISGMDVQLPGVSNYKEYVEGILTEPLKPGKKYQVSFYVALDCSAEIASTGIGAYFSKDLILNETKEKLELKPQVQSFRHITEKDGWTRISGTFTAEGNEAYIIIGSFSDTTSLNTFALGDGPLTAISTSHIYMHAYYYLDDVCVSEDDNNSCKCKKEDEVKKPKTDYFLFMLDVSNSMNDKGKLKLMKKEMYDFIDGLPNDSYVGIMTFSDHTSIALPFCKPYDFDNIDAAISKLKGKGATNGDLALRKVVHTLDSLHVDGRCHVIMATDGIFELSKGTKALIDSCMDRNNATICIVQFGDQKNADLSEIANTVPESSYNLANKKNLHAVLKKQIPESKPAAPPTDMVFYSVVDSPMMKQIVRNYLQAYPADKFNQIPRR
ncbi:MAG: VWA domain-containing protein [Bacteroidetes bacterium]|nr:VWA domain-containing protein [Bacteroidota bacterium]